MDIAQPCQGIGPAWTPRIRQSEHLLRSGEIAALKACHPPVVVAERYARREGDGAAIHGVGCLGPAFCLQYIRRISAALGKAFAGIQDRERFLFETSESHRIGGLTVAELELKRD